MIHVIIICNFRILLKLLGQHLASFDDISVIETISCNEIEQADEQPDSLKKTGLKQKPDIILFASCAQWPDLKKKLLRVKKRFPDTPIIFISSRAEPESMEFNVIKWGARGFLSSTAPSGILIKAVRACYAKEIWVSRTFAGKMMDDLEEKKLFAGARKSAQEIPGQLTRQELKVIMLIVSGFRNAEIGEKLFISENTVKTHINRLFKKINAKNRLQAALWASKHLAGLKNTKRKAQRPDL
ncbi:MAG: response regulator transcription factor [Thermodesulfobacteriota bacterium]|nr:response regulator transcription factor [Thermodesulfobacteriota bacterium]